MQRVAGASHGEALVAGLVLRARPPLPRFATWSRLVKELIYIVSSPHFYRFHVPVKEFGNGTVIWQGLVFLIALTGKLAVGFLVPNFTQDKRFTGIHFRDCLMTGFSMAAEGEFAFVIAVYSVSNG
jgi:hypothetical protein